MYKALTDIKRDVRVVLDENESIQDLTGLEQDSDALQTDAITAAMILKAIDKVHEMAPTAYVSTAAVLMSATWTATDYGNKADVPADFHRLMMVKAQDWKKPVYYLTDEKSSAYLEQLSQFAGVRATKKKPVAALVPDNTKAGLTIETYPKQKATIQTAGTNAGTSTPRLAATGTAVEVMTETYPINVWYVKKAAVETIETVQKVKVADRCYDAVLYMTANMYLQTIGEAQKASLMAMEAAEMLGVKPQPVATE